MASGNDKSVNLSDFGVNLTPGNSVKELLR